MIEVYTDGSCSSNGKGNAVGGIGVFFSEDNPRNYSCSLKQFYKNEFGVSVVDTNNLAELCAILKACKILEDDLKNGEEVCIFTDSEYSVKALTIWYRTWKSNGWKNASNKGVSNKDVIEKILNGYLLYYKGLVKFEHVKAHTNRNDKHSIGNARADTLARKFVF